MARTYAKVKVAMWQADDDFRSLPVGAQHLYLVLLTHPTLNLAGVTDWRPNRIAALADGWTEHDVRQAANTLAERRYIVTDDATEELLVRTFIKHDGVLASPKTAQSMVTEWGNIYSPKLRTAIAAEASKLAAGVSDTVARIIAPLLAYASNTAPDQVPHGLAHDLPHPVADGVSDALPDTPSDTQTGWVRDSPATNNHQPTTNNQRPGTPKTDPPAAEFDTWWTNYPRKDAKGQARKAYTAARRKTDATTLLDATQRFAELCKRSGTEQRYIKLPATWLNGECWDDETLTTLDEPDDTWDRYRRTPEDEEALRIAEYQAAGIDITPDAP